MSLLLAAALGAQVAFPRPCPIPPAPAVEQVCDVDCDSRGCYLLVYRYTFTDDDGNRVTRETFDALRFPTHDAALCGARALRMTGVTLPTLDRYSTDSNVIPDSITPMPHLMATELGISPAHPWQAGERPIKP